MKSLLSVSRKLKGVLLKIQIDRFLPIHTLDFLSYLSQLSRWIRKHKLEGRNDFYTGRFDYSLRYELYKYVLESESLNTNIDYLEFGVSQGHSFRWWIENISDPSARFFGFDTFTGLPEDWGPFKKGDMGTHAALPQIKDTRHQFYEGLFQQTLVPFLASYKPGSRRVIHMDADIYTATLYVLTLITPFLRKGDIIFFDEFNVPLHEFKAFNEWTKSFYINYRVIGSVNNFYQMALIIE